MAENVMELLERTARRMPDQVALAQEDLQLTFGQFYALVRAVGKWLRERGLAGKAVGVAAVQSVYTPVLFLGVACAGGCYVPLNPDLPREKLAAIVADCQMPVVLTWGKVEAVAALGAACVDVGALNLAEDAGTRNFAQDAGTRNFAEDAEAPPTVSADTPLYLIYTSGSTGQPKGIQKSHGAVLSFVRAYCQTFDFGPKDVIGNQTPFFFDASAKDLYMTLAVGCRLEIIPRRLFLSPVRLIEYLNARKVSIISWVPSALSIVSQFDTFRTVRPESLRRVMFVGEVFPMKQLNRWRSACPEIDYVNLYGSSELAGVCCFYPVTGEFSDTDTLPVGKPLPNCQVLLMKDGNVIDRPEELGEIYVASSALADGYYHDAEKTAASFPVMGQPPRRYFRSGDLARYDAEGNLVFAARSDFQIKHMGHRIELGEIETAASALPGVTACCCVYDAKRQKILLYVQGEGVEEKRLRLALREKLADYMAPSKVTVLPELPRNANGKIDRAALQNER